MQVNPSNEKKRKPLQCATGFEGINNDDDTLTAEIPSNLTPNELRTMVLNYKEEGISFAETGNFDRALNMWHKALELDPNNFEIHDMKAQAYLQLDLHMQALQAAQAVIAINPQWGYGYQTLARCQREMGEICLSLKNYQIGLSLLPSDVEMQEELVEVQKLSEQLHQMRIERLRELESSVGDQEREANSCIYHLSARASTSNCARNNNSNNNNI